ncbi:MAG: glycosyltransferase family 2 protein [Actinomycetota bacterium]
MAIEDIAKREFLETFGYGLEEPTPGSESAVLTVSVVIPALNEEQNIEWVLRRIPRSVQEVILVDGRSVDDTVAIARSVRPDIVIVSQEARGKGAALRAGFAVAHGDIVAMIDADGSMNPREIGRFARRIEWDGLDLVKGSRRWPGGSLDLTTVRSVGNRLLLLVANLLFNVRFTELCYGFMAFRRSCLDALALTADGFEIEAQIVVNALGAGLKVAEVPTQEFPRLHGRSKLCPVRDGLRVLRTLLGGRLSLRSRRSGAGYPAHPAADLADRTPHPEVSQS